MTLFRSLIALVVLATAMPASGAVIVLDFEGIPDQTPVGDFYNGGPPPGGTNYGVEFSDATLALIDADAGGAGNFANEPSPNTIMFFLDANNAILNFAAGFDTGFSFFYTSATAATVTVYEGVGATGNVLGTLDLVAQFNTNCVGDPSGDFCNFTPVGVSFAGTARSIDFGGTANFTGFDDITFGSASPGQPTAVPEPVTLLTFGAGLAAFARQRLRSNRR